jgi:hypothetical protein
MIDDEPRPVWMSPLITHVHQKSKRLAILEFTRAVDSADDWELQIDAEKRKRYAPVLEFFSRYQTDRVGL